MKANPEQAINAMLKKAQLVLGRRVSRKAVRTFAIANVAAALMCVLPGLGVAQTAGQLDPTFGKGGVLTTQFGLGNSLGAFEQANGDIVVVSTFSEPTTAQTAIGLLRYTSAGQPDATFGTNGSTVTTFPGGVNVTPIGFAQQPDGAFLVAAQVIPGDMGLARYTSNGILDTTFGSAGTVTINIPGNDSPAVLLLQPNGQIVLAGVAASGRKTVPNKTVLLRFNSNGTPDSTFGSNGTVLTPGQGPSSVVLLSNGDYLVLGAETGGTEFGPTGALLATVTPGPIVVAATNGFASAVQSNGESIMVSSGGGVGRGAIDAEAARFTETGTAVPAFVTTPFSYAAPGTVLTPLNNGSTADAVAIQSNGQILVGGGLTGSAADPTPGVFGLARLNASGTLDSTFGSGGRVTTAFSGNAGINSLLIETNGDIVAVGGVFNPSTGVGSVALARYLGQ
jgi:uncharacterized delta-60 repeat protein